MSKLKKFFLGIIKDNKKEISRAMTILTIGSIVATAIPFIYGMLFDLALIQDTSINLILSLILLWLFAGIISGWLQNKSGYMGQRIGFLASYKEESKAYGNFLKLPVSFHKEKKSGEVLNNLSRGAWQIESLISSSVGALPQILVLIFSLIVMSIIQWQLAVLLLISFSAYLFVTIKPMDKYLKAEDKFQEKSYSQYGKVYDKLYNVFLVKNFGMEERERDRIYDSFVRKLSIYHKKTTKNWNRLTFYQSLVYNFGFVIILGLAIIFLRNGDITQGQFIMFFGYINLAFSPFWQLTEVYKLFKKSSVAIERFTKISGIKPEEMKHGNKKIKNFSGKINLENISFSYSKNNIILDKMNLEINGGESVALVGRSGEGKTTLSELILGYYQPKNGRILFDGIDISKLDLSWIRNQIAVVPQELSVLNDTLINNLRYSKERATKSEIVKAAKAAGAHDFITKLPKGYKTIVGERGVKLSTGQKQRIALTMAFLRDPKILILDEPTSALDSESERIVQKGIEKLIKGRTTIIIAHRFSTVRNADKIVVLEGKKISEIGKHSDLMRKRGTYHKLYKLQAGID